MNFNSANAMNTKVKEQKLLGIEINNECTKLMFRFDLIIKYLKQYHQMLQIFCLILFGNRNVAIYDGKRYS